MTVPPKEIVDAAQNAQERWRVPASVSIAQWALESGWGAHSPGNNPFGIKAMPGYATQSFATHEFVRGQMVPCVQTFAKFGTIDQAFECHAKLLATSRYYADAMHVLPAEKAVPTPSQIETFVKAMAVHYATDPLYANKVMAVIHGSNLEQYDRAC